MGVGRVGCGRKGHTNKNKQYRRGHDMKRRGRDLDQVQDDMKKIDAGKPMTFKFDDDLPGGGQFYVWETGKHFIDADSVKKHKASRMFRRRLQELKQEQYTQEEADRGAGKSKEVLPPAHPELSVRRSATMQEE